MEDGDLLWTLVIGVVLVVGLCGVVLPVLPGLLLMWVAALIYGFAVGWSGVGVGVMVVATVLVAIGLISGIMVPRQAAAESGASGLAQIGGLVGAVIGFFVIPVLGVIAGALIGIMVVEYLRNRDWALAWTATKGTARGFGLSIVIDLGLGMTLLILWAIWALTVLL